MRVATQWKDYAVIDTSRGEKLERFGNEFYIRPDPQIIWDTPRKNPRWKNVHAHYFRSSNGGGEWKHYQKTAEHQVISYKELRFNIRPTGFKHMGVFPEQAVNWDLLQEMITNSGRTCSVLNLFAYTGGATLACAQAGAEVCHVDASRGIVSWARENAVTSGLEDRPIRWIVDDCIKFVEREIRRGRRYDGIIMDPPSYGRGPNGEVWKLEEQVYSLVQLCRQVLSDRPLFFLLNSYTTGLSPSVMAYLLGSVLSEDFMGEVTADEIGLPVEETGFCLPCGSTAIFHFTDGKNKRSK
ncbi:MAG TPA: class I SAM-dependent methyltransferase [Firmicutes bacterium]|nr:class I SAM-dependent methyltransferase [Bacillota bacterium]